MVSRPRQVPGSNPGVGIFTKMVKRQKKLNFWKWTSEEYHPNFFIGVWSGLAVFVAEKAYGKDFSAEWRSISALAIVFGIVYFLGAILGYCYRNRN